MFGSWTEQSSEGRVPVCLHMETQGQVCVCAQGTVSCITRRAAGTAKWNSHVCWDCQMNPRVNEMENVKCCSIAKQSAYTYIPADHAPGHQEALNGSFCPDLLSKAPLEGLQPPCCNSTVGLRWKVLDTAVKILLKGRFRYRHNSARF